METKSENKICQNCKKNFVIEPEDFNFYEKIKVPPPSFCSECRMQRRMAWRNERTLHRNKCAKTGKSLISCFSANSPFIVYERNIWWSDKWDPTDYGLQYDFKKSFFAQFRELLEESSAPESLYRQVREYFLWQLYRRISEFIFSVRFLGGRKYTLRFPFQ